MIAIKEKFSPKYLLSILVMGSLLTFLWILSDFTVKYFVYVKQSNYSIAQVFEWGVIEMDEDNFLVCADFRFHTDGTEEHVSQHIFEKKPFATMDLAEKAIEAMKAQEWKCYWFGNTKAPTASIERIFPLKSFCYSIVALGIFIYFTLLKRKLYLLQRD
ncbi:MAG: hypothetical protein S4CHLAM20_05810 [Chlamydiia bacterium]|nr:hypothetical protein [Chlamydiia bacterium]